MARPLRIEFAGALYHVTARGNEKRPVFRSDADRLKFLDFLAIAVKRFNWSLTAWVLMSNHFHLVVQTREANISRGMQWLNGTYASWFNKRHKRCGHLFQGRFKGILVEEASYFAEVIRYVVLNPVRAGMVAHPEDYRWSSFRTTAGIEAAPAWLDVASVHALFQRNDATSAEIYQEFVLARVDAQERLWDQVTNGIYLGGEAWSKKMRALVESWPRSTDHPIEQRAIGRPSPQQVIAAVSRVAGVAAEDVRSRAGGQLRWLISWISWHEGLVTLRSIAASLRLQSQGQISTMIGRCERELGRNPSLLAKLDRTIEILRS